MPNPKVATTVRDVLNRAFPAANYIRLGDLLEHLIVNVNALQTAHIATTAKLDTAGATVSGLGTNYTATVNPVRPAANGGGPITAITTLENRT